MGTKGDGTNKKYNTTTGLYTYLFTFFFLYGFMLMCDALSFQPGGPPLAFIVRHVYEGWTTSTFVYHFNNVLTFPSFLNGSFSRYRILGWEFLSGLYHPLPSSRHFFFPEEKYAVNLYCGFLGCDELLLLFFPCKSYPAHSLLNLGMQICGFIFNVWKFSAIISYDILLSPFFIWEKLYAYVGNVWWCPRSLLDAVHFSSLFSFSPRLKNLNQSSLIVFSCLLKSAVKPL